jgi:capsular exopolysaccharide synthesis family protein
VITGLYAGWIRRRWWVPVLTVLAATAVGAFVASSHPGSYTASMVFVVKSTPDSQISPDGAQRLASTYAALLLNDDSTAAEIGRAVKRQPGDVQGRLTAVNPVNTALVRVTYEGRSKSEALTGMAALQRAMTGQRPASPAVRPLSVLPVQAANVTPPSNASVSIILAAMFGLCAGAVLVIALERSDVRIDDASILAERIPDIPVLGTVASVGRHGGIAVRDRPLSPAAEGFHGVRVALERLGFGGDIELLVVISADKQEGKSTFAANLGMAMARQNRTVHLINGDMRRPGLERLFDVTSSPGWADLLREESFDPAGAFFSVAPDLWLVPAGFPDGNPAELLETGKIREVLKRLRYGNPLVIVDTPPALQSADAVALAGVADGAVLIVRSGRSRLRSVQEVAAGLRRDNIRILGIVLVDHRDHKRRPYGYKSDDRQAVSDSRILSLESHARRSNRKGGEDTKTANKA